MSASYFLSFATDPKKHECSECAVDQLPKRVAVIAALICIVFAQINKSMHFGDAGGLDAPEEGCYTSSYL